MDDLQIFTDESGLEGYIGSAAIVIGSPLSLQHMAGSIEHHTVFEGEIIGVLLALQLAWAFPHAKSLLIALDNQAVIRALASNIQQPGQYLLDAVHESMAQL